MNKIKLQMLPLSSADFEFDAQGKLPEPNRNIPTPGQEQLKSVLGIKQASNRILKTSQALQIQGTSQEDILAQKSQKLESITDNEIYPIFKQTAEALLEAGFTKSQALNKARSVAFSALKESLDTLSYTDPDIFPRSVLATQLKDPSTLRELSSFIQNI